MSHVYRLRCKITKESYIGFAACPKKRFREHRCLLRKGTHTAVKLQALWDKYGEDQFEVKVLRTLPFGAPTAEKRKWEEYWMGVFDEEGLLLNQFKNSFCPPPGAPAKAAAARVANKYRQSAESNRKRSEAQKGIPKGHGAKISATKRKRAIVTNN